LKAVERRHDAHHTLARSGDRTDIGNVDWR
jgi:hypothetical protein